jgi:ATP-dependent DNA helicase DinG
VDDLERFLSDDGPLAQEVPGFRARPGQLEMARAFLRCLESPGARLCLEGGTGTGKSLAYLSAAVLSGQQVIISTKTKALQDQLADRDLPALARAARAFGLPPKTFAVMKGRGNYLCHVRFDQFRAQPRFVFREDKDVFPRLLEWAEETEVGDRDELEGIPDRYPTWSEIDAGGETCVGTRCEQYEDCFVTRMRRRAQPADIVVVNHHLLVADLRVRMESAREDDEARDDEDRGFAQVLPRADAVIIDEAHALPDVASEHLAVRLRPARADRLQRDVARVAQSLEAPQRLALLGGFDRGKDALDALFAATERARKDRINAIEGAADLVEACRGGFDAAALLLMRDDPALTPQQKAERDALGRRAMDLADDVRFLAEEALGDPDYVVWREGGQRDQALCAAPASAAGVLSRTLFDSSRPIAMTSATLFFGDGASGGSDPSASFRARVGAPEADVERFPSPFPFEERAALYCPRDLPEPKARGYDEALQDELRFLLELSQGGALLLFTSYRALNATGAALQDDLAAMDIEILKQGDAPKRALLKELSEHPRAALFATHTFWEGVDVRGPALRLVAIDRLPFRPPDDPLTAARGDLCRQEGGDPFRDLSVPEAALALKQGVGRLMRSADDAGVVAILDARLRRRGFGRDMLASLPPLLRVGSRDGLRRFWDARVSPTLE